MYVKMLHILFEWQWQRAVATNHYGRYSIRLRVNDAISNAHESSFINIISEDSRSTLRYHIKE